MKNVFIFTQHRMVNNNDWRCILKQNYLREDHMKKLIALFTPVLFAASLFAAPASAYENNQLENAQVISVSGGGQYHQCFLEGKPGCK